MNVTFVNSCLEASKILFAFNGEKRHFYRVLGFLLRDGMFRSVFISDVVNHVDLFKQSCSCTCVPLLLFPSLKSLVRIAYFISIYFVSVHLFWHLQTVTTFICPEPFAVPLNLFNSGSVWMLFLYWFTVIWRNTEFCHVIKKSEFLLNSIINI